MAEQRANLDIQDVLSSIRRLVSEEPQPPRRADVLVLTPALRVVEGSAAPRAARPAPKAEPRVEVQPEIRPDPRSHDRAEEVADTAWPVGLPFRDSLQSNPVRLADFASNEADFASIGASILGAAPARLAPQPGESPLQAEARLAAKAAAKQDSAAQASAEASILGQPRAGVTGLARPASAAQTSPAQANIAQASAGQTTTLNSVSTEQPMPAEDDIAAFFSSRARPDTSLEERIADLQAAIAQTGAEFEPDGSERPEALNPSLMRRAEEEPAVQSRPAAADPVPQQSRFTAARPQRPIEDAIEVTPKAQPQQRPAGQSQVAPQQDYEEALIDEDSLREIVAELVRQELRGELGERITRNVRSLIRRELNSALALRDLSDER